MNVHRIKRTHWLRPALAVAIAMGSSTMLRAFAADAVFGPPLTGVPATQPTVDSPGSKSSPVSSRAIKKALRGPLLPPTDRDIASAEAAIKAKPESADGYVRLSSSFMRKARETADGAYYLRAEAACDKALGLEPANYAALRQIGHVYVGEHRFADGERAARKAIAVNPKDPWNYGTLGDALIEQGNYDAAEQTIQQMVDLKPGIPAFTRIAYLRELFGDPEGAVEMMAKSVASCSQREPEIAAWCRTQLGNLYLSTGKPREAAGEFEAAMRLVPEYYIALAGRGRVRVASGEFDAGISDLRRSQTLVPTHETASFLADILSFVGQKDEAARQCELVEGIEKLNEANKFEPEYQIVLFWADHDKNLSEAVRIGQKLAEKRKDIRTFDALAWALFKSNRFVEADVAMQQAMRLDTKDAQFYFHAGMIQARLGHAEKATTLLQTALTINPAFHPSHAAEAKRMLAILRPPADASASGAK